METFATPGRHPRRERRVQREPRVDGGGAAGRAVDGARRSRCAPSSARWPSSVRSRSTEHERIGELGRRLGVDAWSRWARPRARSPRPPSARALEPEDVASYDDPDEALADVRAWARRGDVVLQGFAGRRARAARGGAARVRRSSSPPPSGCRHAARHAARDPGVPPVGLGPADPRGRPAHAPGEDGDADDGRHRHPRRDRRRLPG